MDTVTVELEPPIVATPAPADTALPAPAGPRLVEWDLDAEIAATEGPPLAPAGIPAIMDLAVHLHDEGHLRESELIFRRVLRVQPDHVGALHHLGVVRYQLGAPEQAVAILDRAVAHAPEDAELHRNLGEAHRSIRNLDTAELHIVRSLALDPHDPDTLCNLGHLRIQQGCLLEAADQYRRALTFKPDDSALLTFLGAALCHAGHVEDAAKCFNQAVQACPDNVTAGHLLASLRNDPITAAPREYIVDLFDTYADSFDEHLVESLCYDGPAELRAAVDTVISRTMDTPPDDWRIIDLGCGTGLCGVAMRPLAGHLVGVDLSPRMIQLARRRNIYDTLLVDDVSAALAPEKATTDLIIAGDVLLYVGDLEETFRDSARALRPGGLFALTTERCESDSFAIQSTGRFAHGDSYVRRLAAEHGLDVRLANEITIRVESNRPIPGQLFVLQRTDR